MKISELIGSLQQQLTEHGDVDARIFHAEISDYAMLVTGTRFVDTPHEGSWVNPYVVKDFVEIECDEDD